MSKSTKAAETAVTLNLSALARPAGESYFAQVIGDLIADEGGDTVVNRVGDKGGLTKYGISKRANPDVDVANLTREGAEAIYKAKYFDPARIADLPLILAKLVFDAGVNHGVNAAIYMLQTAYNGLGTDTRLKADGVIGDKSVAAITALSPTDVLRLTMLYAAERMKRYGHDATWSSNGNGWSNRLFGNLVQALMQGAEPAEA